MPFFFFLYKNKVGRRKSPKGTGCSGWPFWTAPSTHTLNSLNVSRTHVAHSCLRAFPQAVTSTGHRFPLPPSRLCSYATFSMTPGNHSILNCLPELLTLLSQHFFSLHLLLSNALFLLFPYVYCLIPSPPPKHTL